MDNSLAHVSAPQGEMTGLEDAPVTVERIFRGQEILSQLSAQEPMPYHDGKAPSAVKKALAAAKTAFDSSFADYKKLTQDPSYRPVRAYSRSQAERLGLLPADRSSTLDKLMDAAPTAEKHEAALAAGQTVGLPMLADPGEKHDLPPGCRTRTFELAEGEPKPLAELPPSRAPGTDGLEGNK